MPGRRNTGLHDVLAARFADVDSLAAGEAAARAVLGDADWIATLPQPLDPSHHAARDRVPARILLLDAAAAAVTTGVIRHHAEEPRTLPTMVVVDGRVSWTRYLRAGNARLWRWRADLVDTRWQRATAAPVRPLSVQPLDDDTIVRVDGRRDAVLLLDATADIVSVTVTLWHGAAPFLREYDRVGGDLVRLVPLDATATDDPQFDPDRTRLPQDRVVRR